MTTPPPGTPAAEGARTDPMSLRTVMSRFATGVTVLTTGGEHPHGMTANALTSVSLDPPLVLCCVAQTARLHAAVDETKAFAVSILGCDQLELARYFADKQRPTGGAQFHGVDCRVGDHTGALLLGGAVAWLECAVVDAHVSGDHTIFVGAVLGCGSDLDPTAGALSFYGGSYHRVGVPPDPAPRDPADRGQEAS